MKIRVIIPIARPEVEQAVREEIESALAPDCEISLVSLTTGTTSIESRYAEVLNIPDMIRLAKNAEEEKMDGILIDCLSGAVPVIREVVAIPLIGAFEAAVFTAAMVADRFTIVTLLERVVPMLRTMAREIGVTERLASIRTIGIPVLELGDIKRLESSLVEQSIRAIEEDGAEAIVLGCTGMLQVAQAASERLADRGYPVSVINPTTASIGMLELLIRNGLTHSRLTYHSADDSVVRL